jgi:hypothetical protein
MYIPGDIRSYRSNRITRVFATTRPINVALILVSKNASTKDESGNIYGVEIGSFETLDNATSTGGALENLESEYKTVIGDLLIHGVSEVVVFAIPAEGRTLSDLEDDIVKALSPVDESSGDEGPVAKYDVDFIFTFAPIGYTYTTSNGGSVRFGGNGLLSQMDTHLLYLSRKDPDFEASDPSNRIGQKERYYIVSVPPVDFYDNSSVSGTTVSFVADKFESTLGKRTLIFTGNYTEVSIPSFEHRYIKVFDPSALDDSVDPRDKLVTWQAVGLYAFIRYLDLGNPVIPLTQKTIPNVNFFGTRISSSKMSSLVRDGGILLYSDYANQGSATCYRSILASYYWLNHDNLLSYPEDIEFSILYPEDIMDKENRDFLRPFRGEIASKQTLMVMKEMFKRYKLDSYVSRGLIVAYDSVDFWVDEKDPTLIRGYYRYRPVYPINKIWVEHTFVVV